MRELPVSTQTTPVELADLFNRLSPTDEIGGRPGADGAVVLFACSARRAGRHAGYLRTAIAARVAIDVVMQQVESMPGARPLVSSVRELLDGPGLAQAGWLAPPLNMLARLYRKTAGAMPGGVARIRAVAPEAMEGPAFADGDAACLTLEQRQALDRLLERLMQLPCRSKQPDRR